jgi:hypothetical protein
MLVYKPEVISARPHLSGVNTRENREKKTLKAVWVKEGGHLVQHWIKE